MKAVVQRCGNTTLRVDGAAHAQIKKGLVVYLCLEPQDTAAGITPFIDTLATLELFADSKGHMKHTVGEVGGEIMIIPQFTLAATFTRGRPSFDTAMSAQDARHLFSHLITTWSSLSPISVTSGVFGANMQIETIQDGPVTVTFEW